MIRLFIGCFLLFGLIATAQENRTIDGTGNNETNTQWGAEGSQMLRVSSVNYTDGVSEMDFTDRPTPRLISNKLFDQPTPFLNENDLSDFVWLFGQFLGHDISYTSIETGAAPFRLEIPADDAYYDQSDVMEVSRSAALPNTGTQGVPRQYQNEVTSFIDASMVYGSTQERADWLRTFEGGKLWTSTNGPSGSGDLLPWNTTSKEFGGGAFIDNRAPEMEKGGNTKYFVCGDVRANENPLLLAMHTVFVREHNRLCDELFVSNPDWTDELIYQRARKLVGAYIQNITYSEWLPAIGVHLPEYAGYRAGLETGVYNVFSSAAFKVLHTMIDSDIVRMDNEGEEIEAGNITFGEGLFNPLELYNSRGIDPYFKGMGTQVMQEMDCKMIDELRNFHFDGLNRGLDLVATNIFRGRDRGLADYNSMREDFGLAPVGAFDHISDSAEDVATLVDLYGDDLSRVDAWVGMLAERHLSEDAIFGELVMTIIREQFKLLRDSDRFYFENDAAFTLSTIDEIKRTTLRDILMRNTEITLLQPNVFKALPHNDIPVINIEESSLATTIYPNPTQDLATVKIFAEEEMETDYKLVDMSGQILLTGTLALLPGSDNYLYLEMEEFKQGVYTLVFVSDDIHKVYRIIR